MRFSPGSSAFVRYSRSLSSISTQSDTNVWCGISAGRLVAPLAPNNIDKESFRNSWRSRRTEPQPPSANVFRRDFRTLGHVFSAGSKEWRLRCSIACIYLHRATPAGRSEGLPMNKRGSRLSEASLLNAGRLIEAGAHGLMTAPIYLPFRGPDTTRIDAHIGFGFGLRVPIGAATITPATWTFRTFFLKKP